MSVFEYEYEEPRFESQEQEAFESFESQEMNESLESELAQEMLEITSEEELEEFLGKLISRVAQGASSFMKSGVGKAIGGVLRSVAKTALPMVGSALGSFVAPGIGTAIGGKLGSMASKLLEAEERETMGEAEAEYEAARRYVRWASGTVRNGMRAPAGMPPRMVAKSAAVSSARRYAPTLLRSGDGSGRTSSWRGRRRGGDGGYDRSSWGQPRRRTCSCGRQSWYDPAGDTGDGGMDAGDGDDNEANESFEAMEAFESPQAPQPGHHGGGRWYRRGNHIVIVGA